MNLKIWIVGFWILLLVNGIGNLFSLPILSNLTKVLLMPALVLMLFFSQSDRNTNLFMSMVAALFFSWLGDIFLIYQTVTDSFFLLGLGSFLFAHICYIISFRMARMEPLGILKFRYQVLVMVILLLYITVLLMKIGFGLGSYLIPVIIYAVAISTMLFLSFIRLKSTTGRSFILVFTGAILFVLSDSLIAINKFATPIVSAGVWIMLTYGAAQYLIIRGLIHHLQNGTNKKLS